jgi:hypothetical protein
MDVVVMTEDTYFKRTCCIATTFTVDKFISHPVTDATPALHLLVITDRYPVSDLFVVFFFLALSDDFLLFIG